MPSRSSSPLPLNPAVNSSTGVPSSTDMAPKSRQHDLRDQDSAHPVNHASTSEPLANGEVPDAAREPPTIETKKTSTATTNGPTLTDQRNTKDAEDVHEDGHLVENGAAEDDEGDTKEVDEPTNPTHGTKRKASNSEAPPHKSARHVPPDGDSSKATAPSLPLADQIKLLNFLLSPSSLPLARPKDEIEDLKQRPNGGAKTRTFAASTSPFTPFEELLNALILSRPIGHMLGLRSIRTLLNPPHNLMSPMMIRDIGAEGVRQALDKARTQHRQRTAEEIVLLADAVTNTLGEDHYDVSLERVREECGHDREKERAMLQRNIKGMGSTGLDIFGRRIQGSWGEWYPFADQKTLNALEAIGLPADADELKDMLDEHRKELVVDDVIGDGEERKRRVFVRVLERTVGAQLEGNLEEMKTEALK